MKVLIVGAGGFIGKHLLEYLLDRELDVTGVTSSEPNGICPQTGVLSDNFSIPEGTDTVIYLAQSPFYRRVPEMGQHLLNVNVVSAVRVAEMARQAHVQRFIYSSTGNVYSSSFKPLSESSPLSRDSWYSSSKIHAEEYLHLYKSYMNVMIIRLFGVYGSGQTNKLIPNLVSKILNNHEIFIDKNPFQMDDLDGLRISLIYIDDLVRIIYQLLFLEQEDFQILNISSNEVVSIRHIVETANSFLGKQPRIQVGQNYRSSNLIADIGLLNKKINPTFISLRDGIEKVIDELLNL